MTAPQVNFIVEFAKLCKGTEIPSLYAIWSGISAVSAVLGRRVWVDMGTFSIRPNMYIILVGSSGRFRKSTTIDLAQELLRGVKPPIHFVAESLTPEALFASMARATKKLSTPEGDVKLSEGFVVADELSTLLNRKAYDMGIAPKLIQMFDCKPKAEYETRARGLEVIYNPCLGMLAGSTLDWIRTALPADAVGGGLTSRIIFVYVDKAPPPVHRPSVSMAQRETMVKMTEVLGQIHNARGPIAVSDDAWEYDESEYMEWSKSSFFLNPMLSGYASRRQGHAFRVAMALSASESPLRGQISVERRHLAAAYDLLRATEVTIPRIIMLLTCSEKGAIGELLMEYARSAGTAGMLYSDLLRSVSHKVTAREFDDVLATLSRSGRLRVENSAGGRRYVALS
jgi:hypothetical protein